MVVLTFTIFKDIRTYPIKLIVYLSWCIFLAQTFFIISFYTYDTFFCLPSAMLIHFFFLAIFIWSFCVAFNFYQMIVRRNREAELLEKWYHIFGWGVPAVAILLLGLFHQYGNIGGVCYIKSAVAIFAGFFLPGLVLISANTVIFFFVSKEIHDTVSSAPQADKREKTREFRVYLSIFISIGLSWIFGFLMTLFPPESIFTVIFLVLFSLTTPLQGFLIFVAYCVNAKVFSRWARLFSKVFPFCKAWENLGITTGSTNTNNTTSRQDRV